MGDSAPDDFVGDVGVVPVMQNLSKNSVHKRALVVIIRHYALVKFKDPFAIFACALGVERRGSVDCMQTLQTHSTGLPSRHVLAMRGKPCVCDNLKTG